MSTNPPALKQPPSIWQLAWPTVLTNLLQTSVGLTDVKVVSTLGRSAIAAATTGHRVFFALQAVLMGVSAGTAALVARAWGAGQKEEAAHVLRSSLQLAIVIALIMTAIGVGFADTFASSFGLRGEAQELGAIYMRWISAFACVFALGFVLVAALRAAGDARTPLLIGVVANLLNIVGLYLLVYGGLGFPKVGIKGAALAGGLAFSCACAFSLWLWFSGRLRLQPIAADERSATRMRSVLRIGTPAALEQMVVQAGFIAFTFIISRFYGTTALAAYGIGVQILSVSFVIGFGFSIAASTLVGQHLGAGEAERAARSGWRAMFLAMGAMSVLAVFIVRFARPIAHAIIEDAAVERLIVVFIEFLGIAQPLMAIEFALGGALRGAGDTRFPLLTTFSGLIGGRVLLAVIFTWRGLPVEWIYGALLADYGIKVCLLVGRFRSGKWQKALTAPAA